MEGEVLNLTYASSLTGLCEVNPSFDTGILRIAYTGENRNRSYISKEVFERCVKTIYNCPVVCNYDRETDTLGGHDMDIIKYDDGHTALINKTVPVGCVPESSKIFWENVEEDDGTVREYLCAEVLLWKRQEAYSKIKRDGITAHSMEITVRDGRRIDGIYHVEDFVFTAFTLIGEQPCFPSASLDMGNNAKFSNDTDDAIRNSVREEFKAQMSQMMQEIKESFSLINSPDGDDDTQNNVTKGGKQVMNKDELITKYGIDVNTLGFSIDDYSAEDLEKRFKAMKGVGGNAPKVKPLTGVKFALLGDLLAEFEKVLGVEKVQTEWGECCRYHYADCDVDLKEVYCWDMNDQLLYGFAYTLDGDKVVIDFSSKKRMKYTIAEFDEGSQMEQPSPIAQVFAVMKQKIKDNTGWEARYNEVSEKYAALEKETENLRKFKAETDAAAKSEALTKIFSQFEDLEGVEQFEELKNNCQNYDLEILEEKCFALRGRRVAGMNLNFGLEPKAPKIKVGNDNKDDENGEPYGGLFKKYGFTAGK